MHDFKFISSILKGTVCYEVGKGGLTIWIGFGEKIKINKKEKRTYYLVVQTPWRFLQDKRIILASGDMYIPIDSTKPFDVGNDYNSLYDERVKELNTKTVLRYQSSRSHFFCYRRHHLISRKSPSVPNIYR